VNLRLLLLVFVWIVLTPAMAQAQTLVHEPREDPYPQRRVVEHPPAVIFAEAHLGGAADEIARLWARAAPEIAAGMRLQQPRPVAVYLLSGRTFRRWSRGLLPDWGIGFANWPDGPIALDVDGITSGSKSLDFVLRHEISHVYLGQSLQGVRPPTWFVEGVAQLQSGEWTMGDTFALVQVASVGALPSLSEIAGRFPAGGRPAEMAYRLSLQAVQDIDRRTHDRGGWVAVVEAAARTGRFDTAFEDVVGMRLPDFELQLTDRLRGRYGWLAAIAGASTLFTLMSLLFVAGAMRAYARKYRRLAEMEREEHGMEDEGPWSQ
jgi:hypothetical protein